MSNMIKLEDVIKPTQKSLFGKIHQMFKQTAICRKGSYILVPGTAPIMLLAHLDTVHKEPVKHICKTHNGTILMSPQGIGGDDRCGVFSLLTIRREAQNEPWLLFTCDEEIGGVGAERFCADHKAKKLPPELDDLKLLIEIDRKGENDAVYYDCDNPELTNYITSKGYKTEWGSFSDISLVAPELGVAAVNLSSGYYNAHTLHEYINTKHLNATIERVKTIVDESVAPEFPKYIYEEAFDYFDDGFGSRWRNFYRENNGELDHISKEYRDEYLELLDYYSPDELEMLIAENGERIIHLLWDYDFGSGSGGMSLYEAIYGKDEEDQTNDKKN